MRVYQDYTMEWLQMKDKIFKYLKDEWSIGYYPNLIKLESVLNVFTVRDKSIFYDVLDYLGEYMIILSYVCENGIERITPHPSLELNDLSSKFIVDNTE